MGAKEMKKSRDASRDRRRSKANVLAQSRVELQLNIAPTSTITKTRTVHKNSTGSTQQKNKVPITGRPGEFRKVVTAEQRQRMQQHVDDCDNPSCTACWNGPWGPFIGGKDGRTHFDLTECSVG